jgi:hypothetical protein
MKRQIEQMVAVAALMCATDTLSASTLEELARQGFGVVEDTQVSGEFQGCEFGRRIAFTDGLLFVCGGYSYHYAYSPEALVLKSVRTGEVRVLIDDEEYDGKLYRQ